MGISHPNHAGDLPPLILCNGDAYLAVEIERFRMLEIIGRTVVIHCGTDDLNLNHPVTQEQKWRVV